VPRRPLFVRPGQQNAPSAVPEAGRSSLWIGRRPGRLRFVRRQRDCQHPYPRYLVVDVPVDAGRWIAPPHA
jgi:hypothetical protein